MEIVKKSILGKVTKDPVDKRLNIIQKDEHFSVSLLSANICGFHESRGRDFFTPDLSNRSSNQVDENPTEGCTYDGLITPTRLAQVTRGEIAFIANVGEYKDGIRGFNTSSLDDKAGGKGRVIYYNDDLRESGQLINAVNLPIYGPQKYNGKNFFFEMWILELDNQENQRTKAMLAKAANLGAVAYPASSPVLGVLNSLGGALLTAQQDDVEYRHKMRFDVPAHPGSDVYRLPLAEGYYAFLREESRSANTDWSRLKIDQKQGVICSIQGNTNGEGKNQETELCNVYRDKTWLLVRIAKETADAALAIEYGEDISVFINALNDQAKEDVIALQEEADSLVSSIEKLVDREAVCKRIMAVASGVRTEKDKKKWKRLDCEKFLAGQTPAPIAK